MIGRKKRGRTKGQNLEEPHKGIQILFCKQMRAAFLIYYQFVYGEVTLWWVMESRWRREKGTTGKGVPLGESPLKQKEVQSWLSAPQYIILSEGGA